MHRESRLCILLCLNFLTVKELSTKRHFIVWAAKLNQHICFKGILSSKFESKDMLLWKKGFSFVSTDDENLWNPSRLMWFYGLRPEQELDDIEHNAKVYIIPTMPTGPHVLYIR